MLETMNAGGNSGNCPGVLTFDTGNRLGTGISGELVKDAIDLRNKICYTGVARDDDGKAINKLCSTIKTDIKEK